MATTAQLSASPTPPVATQLVTFTLTVTADGDPSFLGSGSAVLTVQGDSNINMTLQGVSGNVATFTASYSRGVGETGFRAQYVPPALSPGEYSSSNTVIVSWTSMPLSVSVVASPNPAVLPGEESPVAVNFTVKVSRYGSYVPMDGGSATLYYGVHNSNMQSAVAGYDHSDSDFSYYLVAEFFGNPQTYDVFATYADDNVLAEPVTSATVQLVVQSP